MDLSYDIELEEEETFQSMLTDEHIHKMRSHIKSIPFPDYMSPTGGAPLRDMDDETLLNAPPHVIAHIQRTAAQGGLQVISPRQVPFSYLMRRVTGETRQLGDHTVGSVADPTAEWPTLDDEDMDHWLPDEPLPTKNLERAHRPKTRTLSLTTSTYDMTDPILSCLIKGRAVVDLLRRDDVQGGADTFCELLAKAWGIDKSDIDELDAYSLGVEGSLLRHAIKTDEVYTTIYAPIHIRRCISVGCSEVTRSHLPEDSAIDWRRMRVFCEAVFAMTCAIEGIPIKFMRAMPPPGDLSAPGNRPNVMTFQPSPAVSWSYEGSSFSLDPLHPGKSMRCSAIPKEVIDALSKYVNAVRPISHLMDTGVKLIARRSNVQGVSMPMRETITSSYQLIARTMVVGAARGRFAASTMRNAIYDAMEQAPPMTRLRLTRYISVALDETKAHLGLYEVPDSVIVKLADRFLDIGPLIRSKIAGEAARRNTTLEEWWKDILAQAPKRFEEFTEGTKGWTIVGMWLLFKEPTEKWRSLATALKFSALRAAQAGVVGGIRLPAEKGSTQRLLVAAQAATKAITVAYSGYYRGVYDVGAALADEADNMNRPRTANVLREAAYLWSLRARAFRGTNVDLIAKESPTPNANHMRIPGPKADLLLIPVPYRSYGAYQSHVAKSILLPVAYKEHIAKQLTGPVSKVFTNWGREIYHTKETLLTRYLCNAMRLGDDLEKSWTELANDIRGVVAIYGFEDQKVDKPEPSRPQKIRRTEGALGIDFSQYEPRKRYDYHSLIGGLDYDQVEWAENILTKLGPEFEAEFTERHFDSADQILDELFDIDEGMKTATVADAETIR